MFQDFDKTLNSWLLLINEKADKGQLKQFQVAFNSIHQIWVDSRRSKVDINKKMMRLYLNLKPILALLPDCLDDIKQSENVYLKIEKTLKVKMEDEVYWEFDALYLAPNMWIVADGEECLLTKPLVEILLNNHTVTDDARYGYHQCVEYKDGQPFKVYQKKAEKSDGEYLKVPINDDGFYGIYCHAINITWQKYLQYPKDISALFYNRRGWRVIAKEEGKFKLIREEYSWDIEEVLIDFTQDNPYDVWKGKTADPLDVKNEIDYQLEIFGWKGYAEKFQLPAIWEFGNPKTMEFYQYTPQKWAYVFFKLAMIQSWLYISENHMYYRADHIFDM